MDEEAGREDTESVLAAYRERKRQALEAQRVAGHATPAASPSASGVHPPAPAAGAAHPPAPAWPPPMTPPPLSAPSYTTPYKLVTPAVQPPSTLEVQRPASSAIASAPGATLSALGPALRLSDALLKDTKVSVKGSPALRTVGFALVLLGLLGVVLDRRAIANETPVPAYLMAGLALLGLGCLFIAIGLNFPRNRRLAVRLAANQREEWKRVQGESQRLVWMSRGGAAASVLGLLIVVAAYTVESIPILAVGGLVTVASLALLAVARVRRGIARRLYVQTLVLSGLEASGLGGSAPDDRVQPVILALDRLLGALPESEVQAFLATPQAQAYLQLVDEATRSQRGP